MAGAAALVAALARSRRSRLGLRGAAARRPRRTPGTCHPWRASATTRIQHLLTVCAGVPGHQGDRHRSRVSADHPWGLPRWHLPGLGRSALPKPPPGMMGVSRNLSRAPTASLRDRLRRHLTEPARLLADARVREKVHNRDMTQQRRRANRHGLAGAARWVRSHLLGWWPRRPPMVGVREPRRPKPTLPAAAVALKEPRAMRWIKLGNRHTGEA